MISRSAVETRRLAIPLYSIEYSQARTNKYTKRRSDCSGLISYVWDLPDHGAGTWLGAYTTQSLWERKLIREIPREDLLPGDAIGYCGPNTANGGGGHIALYLEHDGDRVRIWDHGSGFGPKDRVVWWDKDSTGWLSPGKCKAWRYVGIEEQDDMALTLDERREWWYGIWRAKGLQDMADPIVIPANPERGVPTEVTEPNMLARAIRAIGGKDAAALAVEVAPLLTVAVR